MNRQIIDEETAIIEIGDKDFYYELIDELIDSIDNRFAILQEAIEKNDFKIIINEAHSLKGVSANLYLENLRSASLNLETAAKENKKDNFNDLFYNLKSKFEELNQYRKNLS